jgi:hypothetical protein
LGRDARESVGDELENARKGEDFFAGVLGGALIELKDEASDAAL